MDILCTVASMLPLSIAVQKPFIVKKLELLELLNAILMIKNSSISYVLLHKSIV